MTRRVEIIDKKEVFKQAIFRIEEAKLRYERFNGTMSEKLTRLNLNRGDSAAIVIHDPNAETVIMIEQFRYSTYEKGPGWMLEIPAGVVQDGEDPTETVRREVREETGYVIQQIQQISKFYPSPGGMSERIYLYYASASPKNHTSTGGGVLHEGEDIRTIVMKVNEALRKVSNGDIVDAKTIIGLQWLQLNKLI
jgi:nudix-type nucleoside diphosphatase (YffH/AdpP family)